MQGLGLCRSDYTERNNVANASETLHQLSNDKEFSDQIIARLIGQDERVSMRDSVAHLPQQEARLVRDEQSP
jgi:hypothetical protein